MFLRFFVGEDCVTSQTWEATRKSVSIKWYPVHRRCFVFLFENQPSLPPTPNALVVNKSPTDYIVIRALNDLLRENRGSLNTLMKWWVAWLSVNLWGFLCIAIKNSLCKGYQKSQFKGIFLLFRC